MSRRPPEVELEPELEAFLKRRRINRPAPPELRARALARARSTLVAEGLAVAAPVREVPAPSPVPVMRSRGPLRVALAASVVIAAGAAGAFAALHGRAVEPVRVVVAASPPALPAVAEESSPAPGRELRPVAPPRTVTARLPRPARPASGGGDPFTAEIALLQRAQAAYTRRDFSGTLILIAEHARRFPQGPLAEEREALRVRSLVGSGRTDEAHRAAAAFAVRFPRSVLLPRVSKEP